MHIKSTRIRVDPRTAFIIVGIYRLLIGLWCTVPYVLCCLSYGPSTDYIAGFFIAIMRPGALFVGIPSLLLCVGLFARVRAVGWLVMIPDVTAWPLIQAYTTYSMATSLKGFSPHAWHVALTTHSAPYVAGLGAVTLVLEALLLSWPLWNIRRALVVFPILALVFLSVGLYLAHLHCLPMLGMGQPR